MKAIIDGKLYDTETSEFLFGQSAVEWSNKNGLNVNLPYKREYEYWRTAKGAYFATIETGRNIEVVFELVSEEKIRSMLAGHPDIYIRLFGDVEEA